MSDSKIMSDSHWLGRIRDLMQQVGMPDSQPLYLAFTQLMFEMQREALAAAPRAAQERIQEQASALRQIARLANAQLRRPDEPSTALPDAPCRLTEEANRIAALPEAETVNTMLWLYRRIPKAYGRLQFVEKEIRSLAAKLGMNVEALLAERAALPEEAE